jgi:hypothetical protein
MSLNRAAPSHVFGVKVQDHPFAAKAVERNLRAILRGKGEAWRCLSNGGHGLLIVCMDGNECNRKYHDGGEGKENRFSGHFSGTSN